MCGLRRGMQVLSLLGLGLISTSLAAQVGFSGLQKDRAGRMEITLGANNVPSWSREHADGSSLRVDSDTGWSFGLGYNYDNHWNFGFNLDTNDQRYSAVLAPQNPGDQTTTINHKMSVYHAQFNGTYHFSEGAFTPYIQAGGGWSTFDSNIAQEGSQICWWDPWWWTYRCTWASYGNSDFSYNLGAGLRYEFNRNLFIRAAYTSQWAEAGNQTERFDIGRIEIGFML